MIYQAFDQSYLVPCTRISVFMCHVTLDSVRHKFLHCLCKVFVKSTACDMKFKPCVEDCELYLGEMLQMFYD